MPGLAGIDGCKGGWVAAELDTKTRVLTPQFITDLAAYILAPAGPQLATIDIPIGLSEDGSRECDVEARKLLQFRRSSVFRAPLRAALNAKTRSQADEISRGICGKGVGAQSFGIYPKVKEVDDLLQSHPELQTRLREIHPELCFWSWNNNTPMSHPKRTGQGFGERIHLIANHFGESAFDDARKTLPRANVAEDDILDAFAALWTAERIFNNTATRIPTIPVQDSTGLDMAMWN